MIVALLLAAGLGDPVAVVDRQTAAYNTFDAKGFLATYADDAILFRSLDDPNPRRGKGEFAASYRRLFARRDAHVDVKHLWVAGDHVVDEEHLVLAGKDVGTAVAIYEIHDDLIRRVWFIESPEIATALHHG